MTMGYAPGRVVLAAARTEALLLLSSRDSRRTAHLFLGNERREDLHSIQPRKYSSTTRKSLSGGRRFGCVEGGKACARVQLIATFAAPDTHTAGVHHRLVKLALHRLRPARSPRSNATEVHIWGASMGAQDLTLQSLQIHHHHCRILDVDIGVKYTERRGTGP